MADLLYPTVLQFDTKGSITKYEYNSFAKVK